MPIVSEQEACTLSGMSPEICAAQIARDLARNQSAKEWCGDFLRFDPESLRECAIYCGARESIDMRECVSRMVVQAHDRQIERRRELDLYLALAFVVLLLAVGWVAFRAGRRPNA